MFPLRHPLKPQISEQPSQQPDLGKLELSDEYIAELLLREARDAAKKAEKYGVMSYLSGSRPVPQRKDRPDAQFFQNVMKDTVGSSEFQERKRQLQRMQQDEVAFFRQKHLSREASISEREKDRERSQRERDRHHHDKKDKRSKHKKEKKSKKEKKEKKEKKKDRHSTESHAPAAAATTTKPHHRSIHGQVRGRGARAFNPLEPDRTHNDAIYESLPVQRDDPPEVLARRQQQNLPHSPSLSSSSSSSRSSSRSRSRSPPPRRKSDRR